MGHQNPRIPIEFDAAIDALRQTPDWRNPPIPRLYRDLEDDLAGLGEIVFEFEEEQPASALRTGRRASVG